MVDILTREMWEHGLFDVFWSFGATMAIIDTHIAKKSVDDGMSLHIDYEVILKKNM